MAAHVVGSAANYATIQAAVDAAPVGGTVTVDAGMYNEYVVVGKTVTLLGAQANKDGRGMRGTESIVYNTQTAFKVMANNVVINGFTIKGNGANIGAKWGAGIIEGQKTFGTQVLNNVITKNVAGLYLANSSDTVAGVVRGNLFLDNRESGETWDGGWNGSRDIYSDGDVSGGLLTNVLIDNNTFKKTTNATWQAHISFEAGTAGKQRDITITNNLFTSNSTSGKAILAYNLDDLTFVGNTVTGQRDFGSGGVRFEGNCHNVDIQYNTIYNNTGPGIVTDSAGATGNSSDYFINNNNLYGNGYSTGVISGNGQYDGTLVTLNNWWGDATGPGGAGKGKGQAVWANGSTGHARGPTGKAGGSVVFSPWAKSLIDITNVPAPAAAAGLTATATGTASVALAWNPAESTATAQALQRSSDGGVTYTTVATLPPLLGKFSDTNLTAGVAYAYRVVASNAAGNGTPSAAVSVSTARPPAGTSYDLSGLNWVSASTDYGTVQKNASIKGNPITVGGKTYASGLGTHSNSTIVYDVSSGYGTFNSVVGLDDGASGYGSVVFQVWGDGVKLYDSALLTKGMAANVSVSLTGVRKLSLVVTDAGDGIDFDHADWANATLVV